MPSDHACDLSWGSCRCAHCAGTGEEAFDVSGRTYTIPDPPKIPDPPGSTVTNPPAEEPGYKGPRLHTLLRGDDWNGALTGTSVVVPYTFATRSAGYYGDADTPAQSGFDPMTAEALDATQRANIREALTLWEQACGIIFVEVPDSPEWAFNGIRFLLEQMQDGWAGLALPLDGATVRLQHPLQPDLLPQRPAGARDRRLLDVAARGRPRDRAQAPLPRLAQPLGVRGHHEEHGDVLYERQAISANSGPTTSPPSQYIYGTHEAAAAAAIRWAHGPDGSLVTIGNDAENAIFGFDNRDIVTAGGGSDYIAVRGGDDVVTTGAGNDAVFGGAGTDTLITGVLRRQAVVAVGPDQGTVAQHDGMDTYYEVEILRFTDGDLHLSRADRGGPGLSPLRRGARPGAGRARPQRLGHGAAIRRDQPYRGRLGLRRIGRVRRTLRGAGQRRLRDPALHQRARPGAGRDRAELLDDGDARPRRQPRPPCCSASPNPRSTSGRPPGPSPAAMWVTDPEAVDVLRAYVAVLDRRPDGDGLANWTAARETGLGQADLVVQFVLRRVPGPVRRALQPRLRASSSTARRWTARRTPTGWRPGPRCSTRGSTAGPGVAFGFANSTELTDQGDAPGRRRHVLRVTAGAGSRPPCEQVVSRRKRIQRDDSAGVPRADLGEFPAAAPGAGKIAAGPAFFLCVPARGAYMRP